MTSKTHFVSAIPLFVKDMFIVSVLIFGGCCSNLYSLEVMVKSLPKSGNLITFAQISVVALEGLLSNITFTNGIPGLRPRIVPLKNWLVMVSMFLTVSILNNYALGFNISMPLHIVFRSGSLMVSMLIGYSLFSQQ